MQCGLQVIEDLKTLSKTMAMKRAKKKAAAAPAMEKAMKKAACDMTIELNIAIFSYYVDSPFGDDANRLSYWSKSSDWVDACSKWDFDECSLCYNIEY